MKNSPHTAYNSARQFIWRHGSATLLFIAIYIFMTWPLAQMPGTAVLGSYQGDGWKTVEQFWWYQHAVIEQRTSPFFDPHFFYPTGWRTLTSSHSPALMLPTIPLTTLLGPIGAYNLVMFLLGVLWAAVGTYLLVYRLTGDRLAGMIAGVIFAFCMARTLRFGGHLNVAAGSAWIPWIFLCVEEARRRTDGRTHYAWFIAAGLCYAASVLSYFYYVYLVAVPLAAYLLYDIWIARRDKVAWQKKIAAAGLMFGVAAALVAPLALLTLSARNSTGVASYQLDSTTSLVISPDRLLLPNRHHPVWGEWMRLNFPDVGEQSFVFLGIAAVVLAGMAVIGRLHPRAYEYAILTVTSIIMGMGPYLHWRDTLVTFTLPGSLEPTPLPLPGLLFFHYAPFFDVIRVWSRFGFITSLAVAVLAGFAIAWLRPKIRYGNIVALFLLGLVIFESWGQPFRPIPAADMHREVDQWLAAQPESFAIMELPLNHRLNGSLMYSRSLHDKPLALGYTVGMPDTFLSGVFSFLAFPNQETIDTLREWEVGYLLYTAVNETVFSEQVAPAIEQLSGLRYVGSFAGYPGERVHVYRVE